MFVFQSNLVNVTVLLNLLLDICVIRSVCLSFVLSVSRITAE